MKKKLLTKECQNCLSMIDSDTPLTGEFTLCRHCSDRYISLLEINFPTLVSNTKK